MIFLKSRNKQIQGYFIINYIVYYLFFFNDNQNWKSFLNFFLNFWLLEYKEVDKVVEERNEGKLIFIGFLNIFIFMIIIKFYDKFMMQVWKVVQFSE